MSSTPQEAHLEERRARSGSGTWSAIGAAVVGIGGVVVGVLGVLVPYLDATQTEVAHERRAAVGQYYGALERLWRLEAEVCAFRGGDFAEAGRWDDAYSDALDAYGRLQVIAEPAHRRGLERVHAYVTALDQHRVAPETNACPASGLRTEWDFLQYQIGDDLHDSWLSID